jgi:hypothetical protein
MRIASLAILVALLAPGVAVAETFPIPATDTLATVSIPDSWEPKAYDGGVEATSADGKIYVAMESIDAADVKTATEEGLKYFLKQGVDINFDSLKQKDAKINGLDAFDLSFTGKDKDGPANVGLTLVATNSSAKFLLLYYWGSDEGEKANAKDLQSIAGSIQATKR